MAVLCDYCGGPTLLVTGKDVYPHRPDLEGKSFYMCVPCNAWVGCHLGTDKPMGRLANAELRRAKMAAHAAFDPLWQQGLAKRSHAYAWLAEQLEITQHNCHIGQFDVATCQRVVDMFTAIDLSDVGLLVKMHQAERDKQIMKMYTETEEIWPRLERIIDKLKVLGPHSVAEDDALVNVRAQLHRLDTLSRPQHDESYEP
jgi:hypothetical protein